MPSVPVPVFTLAILLMLLAKVSLSGSDCYRRATMFLAGCALLLLLAALRWSFDFQALRQLQSLVAVVLPPLAWRCLHECPRPQPLRQNLMLYAPAVAALSVICAVSRWWIFSRLKPAPSWHTIPSPGACASITACAPGLQSCIKLKCVAPGTLMARANLPGRP